MRNSASKLIQGFSLLSASNARNIKLPVMRVALILCVKYLKLFDYLSAAKRVVPEQRCQKGGAKNAPSWIVIIALPNLQQVGHD